ncbi:MAG TPA: dihydrolipoamide acetyltransferase family protein [Solirubrobacteraceae bacterium]|jgi:pyruvate dehydrogenase E2 component (dihydrolipoamide acetyltransferase)
MAVEIVMPRLSDSMEEGTILRWLKDDGEEVARGEELVEIETDKAAMTYESDQAGTLERIAAEGDTLPVGAPIARLLSGSDSAGGVSETEDEEAEASENDSASGERLKASPLARRLAQDSGVDLHDVTASGPGGRIVKADVLAATDTAPSESTPASSSPTGADAIAKAKGETEVVELARGQETVARRMAESKATIPDFTLQTEVDMEACVELRAQLKRPAETHDGGHAPTYNDMVVKACALALREHRRANGSYRDGQLQLYSRVNVGVAVAAEDTLVVPTVFDADEKSLGEVARETRRLAERARDATITPPELGGGTFTVSNLGMFGVRSFTAIINPPQAAILSVGALEKRAVVRDGELTARSTMSLTLVCDHRILFGAEAARFLARVRELLEAPVALTL